MIHTIETSNGVTARIKQFLSNNPDRPHTIAGITEALNMWGATEKAEISACLSKLLKAGKVTRTMVPALSNLGRREIAAYQLPKEGYLNAPGNDPWMVIYRRDRSTDGSFDLQDVAVPLERFNASEVPADEWQNLRPMRASELNQRYPRMARE